MGYTHYWRANTKDSYDVAPAGWRDKEKLAAAIADMCKLAPILAKTVPLAGGMGEGEPVFTPERVWFNGVGDDSHETFEVTVEWGGKFEFCKTACKPYDAAVTACLCLLKFHLGDALRVNTDGEESDWEEGLRLARIIQAGCEYPCNRDDD